MKRYETLLLDADGTLLDFDRSEAESFRRVLERYGFPPDQSLIAEYHQINREFWEEFEEGRMAKAEVLTVRFERFFAGHGLAVDGGEAEKYYRGFLEKSSCLIDGALPVLDYLREKYALYLVTNGVAETQYSRLGSCGLTPYFREIFVSEEAGSQKPQKEFFEYCFSRIYRTAPGQAPPGRELEKVLVIGDSLTSDIKGGENAGVDTCWYNPGGAVNEKGIPVTYEIKKLDELTELL